METRTPARSPDPHPNLQVCKLGLSSITTFSLTSSSKKYQETGAHYSTRSTWGPQRSPKKYLWALNQEVLGPMRSPRSTCLPGAHCNDLVDFLYLSTLLPLEHCIKNAMFHLCCIINPCIVMSGLSVTFLLCSRTCFLAFLALPYCSLPHGTFLPCP